MSKHTPTVSFDRLGGTWVRNCPSMLNDTILAVLLGTATLAQAQTGPAPTVSVQPPIVLNTGPCLDSVRAVPQVLQAPMVRATQIVRIDKVVSTATMTSGETIGFLYTLQDGTTWLGQRTPPYISPADASAINGVLASLHMPDATTTAFPPKTRFGVKTNFLQFFRIQIPPTAPDALRITIDPCVAWPSGTQLPDPSM